MYRDAGQPINAPLEMPGLKPGPPGRTQDASGRPCGVHFPRSSMTAGSASPLTRIVVTALLLLAVSPVTAPFLTVDLKALLGDSPAPGAAVVQQKAGPDEPVPTIAGIGGAELQSPAIAPAATRTVFQIARRAPLTIPLRV